MRSSPCVNGNVALCSSPFLPFTFHGRKQQTLILWRFGSKIDFFPCRTSCEKNRVAPNPGLHQTRGLFHQNQETNHNVSPQLSSSLEPGPIEIVSHVPRDLIVCLGVFEMDAKHAEHLRATEFVEALWSEQESRDATYRIPSASIQDSRDVVFQIANVLPQKESSEFLEPDEAHQWSLVKRRDWW